MKNTVTVRRLIDKREVEEVVLDTLLAKPLNFPDSYEKMSPSKQTAEDTYLTGGTVLEFNVIVSTGQYVRLARWNCFCLSGLELEMEIKIIWEGGYSSIIFLDTTLKP